LVVEEGADAFRAVLEASRPLIAFVLDQMVPPGDYRSIDAKKAAAARAIPVLAALANAIERDHYRGWLADRLQVSDASLRDALAGHRSRDRSGVEGVRRAPPARPLAPSSPRPRAELVVAAALVQGRLGLGRVRALGTAAFTDPVLREVAELVCSSAASEGPLDASPASASTVWALADGREDAARAIAELAVFGWVDEEGDKEVDDCVTEMEIRCLDVRMQDITRTITELELKAERVIELQQEQNRLKRERERLQDKRVPARAVGG
jgi:DNA primase